MPTSKSAGYCIGVGAMLGLGAGAAAGYGVSRVISKEKPHVPAIEAEQDEKEASVLEPLVGNADAPSNTEASPTPKIDQPSASAKGKTHNIFDTTTHYLTQNSEFFTPLDRLSQYLQFKEEKDTLSVVVRDLDCILGMEILLNTRTPVAAVAIPSIAQKTRNRVKASLGVIVQFSNEERPSETKRGSMQEIADDIMKTVDEIIQGLHQTVAAAPITEQ